MQALFGQKKTRKRKSAWRFIPTGRENCPACANALRETLGSSMGGRGGVYAGGGECAGGGFVGSPAGAPPQAAGGRSPPEPAQRAPCGAWVRGLYGGAGWCGEGARRAPRPKAGDGGGLGPPPRRRRRRPAGRLVWGKCLGECGAGAGVGRGPAWARPQGGPRPGEARPPAPQAPDCGAYPASAERRMVIAGVVRRPPGHGRCHRWPAGFWCAGGGHWEPCPAHREPLPPHGRPSWKGS